MTEDKTQIKLPKYAADIIRQSSDVNAPGLCTVEVLHDAWCDLLNSKGECNCNPEVKKPIKVPDNA